MLAALLANLPSTRKGPSAASRYWERVPKKYLMEVVEDAVEAPAVAKLWNEVKSDPDIENKLRMAATDANLEIDRSRQRVMVAEMLRAIVQEIEDEEAILKLF